MKIPAVSVIVSVYNGEKYLPECLESILAQTLQNMMRRQTLHPRFLTDIRSI